MSREPRERIADIITGAERCRRYAMMLGGGDPVLDEMAEDAIERNLRIIGEAVNHLPVEITQARPDIPWAQIRGFRNFLVHQYFGVEVRIVREVVEAYLPPLVDALQDRLGGE